MQIGRQAAPWKLPAWCHGCQDLILLSCLHPTGQLLASCCWIWRRCCPDVGLHEQNYPPNTLQFNDFSNSSFWQYSAATNLLIYCWQTKSSNPLPAESNPSSTTWSPLWQTEHKIMSLNLLPFTKAWSSRKKETQCLCLPVASSTGNYSQYTQVVNEH